MIATQSVVRHCAFAKALNYPDQSALTGAPFGRLLFGDSWDQILKSEIVWRQVAKLCVQRKRTRPRRPQGLSQPPHNASHVTQFPAALRPHGGNRGGFFWPGRGRGKRGPGATGSQTFA